MLNIDTKDPATVVWKEVCTIFGCGPTPDRLGNPILSVKNKEGKNVCFTPDGPRGPKYQMKLGPVHLASLTGARILPLSINFSSCWELKSWDNFQIPKPFSKITLIMGDTIPIPPNLDAKQLEEQRQKVQDILMSITKDPK